MRALKILLILAGGIVVLLGILGLTGEDQFRIERSVTIAAPPSAVWEQVSTFSAMDKWSPWNEMDPNMKKTLDGTDGTVGAVSRWEGNKDVGKGEQRIDSLVPNALVKTRLKFIEPWEAENDALVELASDGDGTKVTWAMEGKNTFMSKVMSKFMDMDAMLGKDFEKGLGKLKTIAEEAYAAEPKFEITSIDWPGQSYVGKRGIVKWADMKAAFEQGFGAGMTALGAAKLEPAGPPSGVYFEWNEKDQTADMIAAIPVSPDARGKLKGQEIYDSPASKALRIEYRGGYSNLEKAHMAMDAYIHENGLSHHTNVIEEYITDPMSEPDSTKWLTNIIYLVK